MFKLIEPPLVELLPNRDMFDYLLCLQNSSSLVALGGLLENVLELGSGGHTGLDLSHVLHPRYIKKKSMELTKKQLEHTLWTEDKAKAAAPFISRKPDGTYWVGDRRLLLRSDRNGMDQVLKEVYEMLAPNTGYLAFFSAVQQKALGIPRQYAKDWLFKNEGYQLYQPTRKVSSSRAILSKGPLKRLAIDAGTFGPDHKSLWASEPTRISSWWSTCGRSTSESCHSLPTTQRTRSKRCEISSRR